MNLYRVSTTHNARLALVAAIFLQAYRDVNHPKSKHLRNDARAFFASDGAQQWAIMAEVEKVLERIKQ